MGGKHDAMLWPNAGHRRSTDRWHVAPGLIAMAACRTFAMSKWALGPGSYPSLRAMGMKDRISSVRPVRATATVADDRNAPQPPAPSQWRRRNGERLYEAAVTEVRAVVGLPEQRCWLERQDFPVDSGRETNVPGAALGAVLGGVLGHQIADSTGRDLATAGGAVAGAAVGSRVGRDRRHVEIREVQRCTSVPSHKAPQ